LPSTHGEFFTTHGDHVLPGQLPATAALRFPVHQDAAVGEQLFGVRTLLYGVRELEELAEPDTVTADLDLPHAPIIARYGRILAMSGGTPATTALDRAGIAYTTHPYRHDPRAESYGAEAAHQLGLDPRQIFKTLIAAVDSGLVCAVVPVAARLDLKALATAMGARKAELAEPARAQRATGYVLGGISPLGHRSTIPVVLDESMAGFDTVYVSAGKRGLQLAIAPADLTRAAGGRLAPIATH
jgi:Cys-tRNA(Pro)/Cys-tRNA(Cys) deacylase